ncbi:uncharacterized protein [Epargyreus clarus]|uniref:uncharacterized protein n=1 Tax=Epargyreus clarus TaxID=520877 RepID=UPI003C2B06D0
MRVLILSALLACAAAAPSNLFYAAFPAVPVAIPPAGDIQAAAIDAQVKAEDQARAVADRARELAEQAAENQNEGVIEGNDLVKEKSEEAFWSAEEQKWQALDALKTAEAQVDAAAASNSPALARSSFIPYVASGAVIAGVPAVIPSGYPFPVAPIAVAKAAETPAEAAAAPAAPAAPEAAKAEEKEAAVKSAEPEAAKPEAEAEKSADSVQVESADLKAAAPEPAKVENPFVIQSFAQTHPALYSPFVAPVGPALAYSQPWVSPVAYVQPGLKAVATSAIHQVQGQFIAPTVLKTQW